MVRCEREARRAAMVEDIPIEGSGHCSRRMRCCRFLSGSPGAMYARGGVSEGVLSCRAVTFWLEVDTSLAKEAQRLVLAVARCSPCSWSPGRLPTFCSWLRLKSRAGWGEGGFAQ